MKKSNFTKEADRLLFELSDLIKEHTYPAGTQSLGFALALVKMRLTDLTEQDMRAISVSLAPMHIYNLELSIRTANTLTRYNVNTAGQLLTLMRGDRPDWLDNRMVKEILDVFEAYKVTI